MFTKEKNLYRSSLLFWLKNCLKGINMEEVIIKFLDIATIKFIGTPELIELVKKYYPGLENKKAKENYTIKLNTRINDKNNIYVNNNHYNDYY